MKKIAFLFSIFAFLGISSVPSFYEVRANSSPFITETKEDGTLLLTGLNDPSLLEYRIYADNENGIISEIASNAFDLASEMKSIMISTTVTVMHEDSLPSNNLIKIIYTGSEEQWNELNYVTSKEVTFYGYDEGFINYFNGKIRPHKDSSLCDVGKENYLVLFSMYEGLSKQDRNSVDNYVDKAGSTIKEDMAFMKKYYSDIPVSTQRHTELSQSTTLFIILCISIFGMTSICIFYLFKVKEVIK